MSEPIVFLPDVLCDARLFGPQLAELSSEFAVMTAPVTTGERISELASTVLTLAPQRFALAGAGLGGLVAMEILRRAPKRLSRLALISASPLQECPFSAVDYEPMVVAARTGKLRAVAQQLSGVSADEAQGAVLALMEDMALAVGTDRFVGQVRALQRRRDMQSALAKCNCPCLILGGSEDRLVVPKRLEAMAGFLPDAEMVVIEGAGHVPTLQAPAEVTAALRQWMAQPLVLRQ